MLLNICLIVLLVAQSVSLEETLRWIKETLPIKAAHSGKIDIATITERVTEVSFERCALSLSIESQLDSLPGLPALRSVTTQTFQVPLAALDAEKITLTHHPDAPQLPQLHLVTKDEAQAVRLETATRSARRLPTFDKSLTASLWLPMPDKETADRFQKAFRHAIALCRANKKEPF